MIKKVITAISMLLFSISAWTAETATNTQPLAKIEAGKQYVELSTMPSPDKEVIEFFSFNCPSCFRFETELHVSQAIEKKLPSGVTFKRYNLDTFGPLAAELAEAWAVANVLGIQDKISEPIYYAIHRDRKIKTADDIKAVFAEFGVNSETYDKTKNGFLVKAFLTQQKNAVNELQPNSIPTVIVNRKYSISAAGLDGASNESFANDYARVAAFLSQLTSSKKTSN